MENWFFLAAGLALGSILALAGGIIAQAALLRRLAAGAARSLLVELEQHDDELPAIEDRIHEKSALQQMAGGVVSGGSRLEMVERGELSTETWEQTRRDLQYGVPYDEGREFAGWYAYAAYVRGELSGPEALPKFFSRKKDAKGYSPSGLDRPTEAIELAHKIGRRRWTHLWLR